MNDQSTNFLPILLAKFPKVNIDEHSHKDINIFLTLNLYNVELVHNTDKILFFKNLITGSELAAYMRASKERNVIEFVPWYSENNEDEVIAFSFYSTHFTCIRINNNGMFIEELLGSNKKVETKYYDNIAIEKIIGNNFQNNNFRKLKKLLEVLDYSIDDLPDRINKIHNLNPDSLIEAESWYGNDKTLLVKTSKDDIATDSTIFVFPSPISLYAKYLTFMREQGLYSDNRERNLIRIRKNSFKK